jgi:hypothetical protein
VEAVEPDNMSQATEDTIRPFLTARVQDLGIQDCFHFQESRTRAVRNGLRLVIMVTENSPKGCPITPLGHSRSP